MYRLKVDLKGAKDKIEHLRRIAEIAGDAIVEYLVGDDSHGLKHYVPYRYVSPFRSFSADPVKAAKQRGWIFTHLDQIGRDNRTGKTKNAWVSQKTGNTQWKISNPTEGAKWTMGDNTQTRQSEAVGWVKTSDRVRSNLAGAFRHARAKIREYFQSLKKS